jgi:F0F1-type ATP synthase membrane subunit b/b'
MFAKSRKEKFVEQAQDLAHDLSEAIAPHVERARDELAPRLADARDQLVDQLTEAREQAAPYVKDAKERLSDARDQAAPYVQDARDQAAPYVKDVKSRLADARDQAAPLLADARDQAAPYVEDARDRLSKGAAAAVAAATPVVVEAQRRGDLAAAALKGEPVKRKGSKKKYFVFAGLLGLGAIVVQKLRSGGESANWQTSYSPSTAPAAPPAPPSPSTPAAGTHLADVATDSPASGDPVGATPGEALSDAVEEPHPVTTPDAPAEDVVITEDVDKQS